MDYFIFAVFFAFNFSLWFMLPALVLKAITKPGRKRNDKTIKNDYIIYGVLSIAYLLIYIIFYWYFAIAINEVDVGTTIISYFTKDIGNLTLVIMFFLVISILQGAFTYYLAKKLFKLKNNKGGYIIISITGFLNILAYFFSNSVLNLNLYAFEAKNYILNLLLKIDYQILLFLLPVLVFTDFAFSFWKKK